MLIRGSPYREVTTPEHKIQDSPLDRRHRRFDVFQRQLKLLGIGLLRACAKQRTLEVSNQFLQLIDTILLAQIAVL